MRPKSQHKQAKNNLANIQPLTSLSVNNLITHIYKLTALLTINLHLNLLLSRQRQVIVIV